MWPGRPRARAGVGSVEKIAYLLWRDPAVTAADWSHDLRHGATAELLDAGARGVQVNVADDAVADATLRFRLIDPQVEAVVGVWVDSARTAARSTPRCWRPRAPPASRPTRSPSPSRCPTWPTPCRPASARPGSPTSPSSAGRPTCAPTTRSRPGTTTTPVAVETQSTFGYVQNVVARRLTPDAPAIDGIVEELFPPPPHRPARVLRGARRRRARPPDGADGREHGALRRGPRSRPRAHQPVRHALAVERLSVPVGRQTARTRSNRSR